MDMNEINKQLMRPSEYLPKETFSQITKYALIISNQYYDDKYVTHGDLPAVVDDHKNAMQVAKLMGICSENMFELTDATFDQLEHTFTWLKYRFIALTRILEESTGILGANGLHGLKWETLKPFVMKLEASFDSVILDLDKNEQTQLQNLIKEQVNAGNITKKLATKLETTKIKTIPWKKLKNLVMHDMDYTRIKIPLDEHEQLLL